MAKGYMADDLGKVIDLIPDTPDWNNLRLVMVPRNSSSTDLDGSVAITRGIPSIVVGNSLHDYGVSTMELLVGTEDRRTTWSRVEIKEDEHYWIDLARLHLPTFLETYKLSELEFLFKSHHETYGKETTLKWGIKVEGYDTRTHKGVKVSDNLASRDADRKVLDDLLKKFGKKFGRISDTF